MNLVTPVTGWHLYSYVKQDTAGVVTSSNSGLWTDGLSNCLCLIMADRATGATRYGMLHVAPAHDMLDTWVRAMVREVGATVMVVAGANTVEPDGERKTVLTNIIRECGLTVTDETLRGWLDGTPGVTQGTHTTHSGTAALNTVTGQYMFPTMMQRHDALHGAPPGSSGRSGGAGRKGKEGFCVIL